MEHIGAYALPILIALFLIVALVRRVPVFDCFLEGAADGLRTLFGVLPSICGLLVGVEMLKGSGALDALIGLLSPLTVYTGFPAEVLPMALLRPISGGGSIALLDHMLSTYGTDSFVGRISAVMCGSSETTFYTIAVYYGACGVKKTRHTIPAALAADIAAAIFAVLAVNLFY